MAGMASSAVRRGGPVAAAVQPAVQGFAGLVVKGDGNKLHGYPWPPAQEIKRDAGSGRVGDRGFDHCADDGDWRAGAPSGARITAAGCLRASRPDLISVVISPFTPSPVCSVLWC
jgi:hypothetical protein